MSNPRADYIPIIHRKPLKLPGMPEWPYGLS